MSSPPPIVREVGYVNIRIHFYSASWLTWDRRHVIKTVFTRRNVADQHTNVDALSVSGPTYRLFALAKIVQQNKQF